MARRHMRLATAQTVRGKAVAGEALRQLVSERTWVAHYEIFPDGAKGQYRTYEYFRQDGQFIWAHNWHYGEPRAVAGDRWRVDGERLCIVHRHFSHREKCYTVALDAEGVIQLYIDAPGTPDHALLTRRVRNTARGAPEISKDPGK